MGITFTSSATTVVNGDYTFEDIYQASKDAGKNYCKKLGTSYLIINDLILGNESDPTTLTGENISVVIEGDLFQVKKYSELKLGRIDSNTGATSNGVYLSCPNIKNGYGFGSTHKVDNLTQSGDIFIYDSFIDIYGFWGFFGGQTQHCEVIDCLVNGFGRIEGPNSIIRNITTQKSNGRFGVLTPKGIIKEYSGIVSKDSLDYYGHTCSVYLNPTYSPNLKVSGGVFDGYSEGLVYCESNNTGVSSAGDITFIDSDIRNGYGGYFSDSNTQILVVYTFAPTFLDGSNNPLSYVDVVITNNEGEEVFNGTGNSDGTFSIELLKHKENKNNSNSYFYYDIQASKDDVTVTRRYEAGTTYKNFPFFVTNEGTGSGTGSGDCCLEDIQAKLDALETVLSDKILVSESNIVQNTSSNINTLQTNLESITNTAKAEIIAEINENETKIDDLAQNNNQLLITLGEEVQENQDIIESITGQTKMFL